MRSGSPQWQIELLRRLELCEDMLRNHGFEPLGPADGPIEEAIVGRSSAQIHIFEIKKAGLRNDRFAAIKTDYVRRGPEPSPLRCGYVRLSASFDRRGTRM